MDAAHSQRVYDAEITAVLEAFDRPRWARLQRDPEAAAMAEGRLIGEDYARVVEPDAEIVGKLRAIRSAPSLAALLAVDATLARWADPAGWAFDDPQAAYVVSQYESAYVAALISAALEVAQ